jgi:hypothetical protein
MITNVEKKQKSKVNKKGKTMMSTTVEKNQIIDTQMLKDALFELMVNDPNFFSQLLEKAKENQENSHKKELEQIIKETFEEYDDVFKALA